MEWNITFKASWLWDEFYELARDHAIQRVQPGEQLSCILEPQDRRYAACILIANQPFFDPFYGNRAQ